MEEAPMVVLIVGLVFLVMGTMAFISEKYGESMPTEARTVVNETLTTVDETGEQVISAVRCNFQDFTVLYITNETGDVLIPSTNYTADTWGNIVYSGVSTGYYNNTNWNVSYTYSSSDTVACNVTDDLQSEVSSNTSIAGIVLTISLVGIVLTILIGIFAGFRRQRI